MTSVSPTPKDTEAEEAGGGPVAPSRESEIAQAVYGIRRNRADMRQARDSVGRCFRALWALGLTTADIEAAVLAASPAVTEGDACRNCGSSRSSCIGGRTHHGDRCCGSCSHDGTPPPAVTEGERDEDEPCGDCAGEGTIGQPPDNTCANCGGHGVIPAPGSGSIVHVAPPLDEPMPDCSRCCHPASAHSGQDAECATCDDTYEPIGGWGQFPIRWLPGRDPASPAVTAAEDETWGREKPHTLTRYGTTNCPVEGVRANVDDGECSACGAPVVAAVPAEPNSED